MFEIIIPVDSMFTIFSEDTYDYNVHMYVVIYIRGGKAEFSRLPFHHSLKYKVLGLIKDFLNISFPQTQFLYQIKN